MDEYDEQKWLMSEYWEVKDEVNVPVIFSNDDGNCLDTMLNSEYINLEEMVTSYRGSEGESIMHEAAKEGHMKIIEKADNDWDCKSRLMLVCGENKKGETPLHLAAAAGELDIVKAILRICISIDQLGNKKPEELSVLVVTDTTNPHPPPLVEDHQHAYLSEWKPWRMKSTNGDTPIHKALRYGHDQVALYLLPWEPQLISSVTNANESLLYLAAKQGCYDFIQQILSKQDADGDNLTISTSGPYGQNVLHALVNTKAKQTHNKKRKFGGNILATATASPSEDLEFKLPSVVENLIAQHPQLSKKVDKFGKTPLHYAVELGRPYAVLTLLLCDCELTDTSATFIYDHQGFTPLLRAAANGYQGCIANILCLCPYSLKIRHALNGSSFLHLSKLSGDSLKTYKSNNPDVVKLINETDRDGNTPLHSAILDSDIDKTQFLLSIPGVKLGILNKQHQTPMDLCKLLITNDDSKQLALWIALKDAKAKEVARKSDVSTFSRINAFMTAYSGSLMLNDEDLKKLLENVAVAAALLVTLSFAATFTIPGGYDQNTGQTLRMKETSIKVFVATNVVAMLLGIGVLLTYTFGASKRDWLRVSVIPCVIMLQSALLATIVAFISGVYAVVSHDAMWIAILAFAIVATVFLIFSVMPAAAQVVTRTKTWLWKKIIWMRKFGVLLLIIFLMILSPLAKLCGVEGTISNIMARLVLSFME